jgi:hypothetical protein
MKPLGCTGLLLAAVNLSAATFTVTNNADSGAGSLRQAILDANGTPGADTIAFDIPGAGVHTIIPATPLPPISEGVIIDGYTQPGTSENTDPVATNAVLLIELDGTVAGGTGLQFTFGSAPSTIQGLVVNLWSLAISSQANATIRGNFIGTDPTGSSARPNERGIDMGANNAVVVGGTTLADRNLVSGNTGCFPNAGVRAQGAGTVVQGNLIGTDATGTVAIPNCLGVVDGIGGVTIGGAAAGAGNLISGNTTALSLIQTVTTLVHGNRIGTTADGTGPLGNGRGITLGSNVIVGGTAPGEANVIAFSSEAGVIPADGSNNSIRGNSIHDNGGLGIDLDGNGIPRPNDLLDADSGHQNFPIVQSVEHLGPQGAGTRIVGKFNSTASTTFTLDFYSNPVCTNFPREHPEGETYLGELDVTTDVNGNAAIDVTFPVPTEDGARIVATATNPLGDTSEFSTRILFSLSPSSGPDTGGTAINVSGTDFSNPTTLTIEGVDANPVFVDSARLNATAPAFAPGTAHDVVATTTDGTTATLIKGWVSNFLDVPTIHPFQAFVTALVSNGITSGVGGGNYGVVQDTLRQQMAVFLLKAKYGLCYTPPSCTVQVFDDVPCSSGFSPWINELVAQGIVAGCAGGNNYCPGSPVLRQQMAVLLLRTLEGTGYAPPACTVATFTDVPCSNPFASWIYELVARNITAGCGGGLYCPGVSANRGQMAVFVVKTFSLQ